MRFMTAFLAATPNGEHLLTGTERMRHRPIRVLVDALRHLGANIDYAGEEGFPPLRITGRQLEGGQVEISGSVSSQYISALLLIGPVLRQGLTLRLTDTIISRPYIDLTLWVMRELGAKVDWTSADTITVEPKGYVPRPFLVENDWSAASYWYEMVALSNDPEAKVRLHGLMDGSKQGDSIVRYIFSLLGVKTRFSSREPGKPTTVTLTKSNHRVKRLDYDFTGAPDLTQTVVVACCLLGVPFHFTGLQTLRIKETDRLDALQREMLKLGYHLTIHGDSGLSWNGTLSPNGEVSAETPSIDTYDDHRMALAFAPVALCRPVIINKPQVVTKSYPHYWEHLRQAGFIIS
jgi:3-phosphoshikimate 1-carboxyvinyltransferase